MKKTLFLTLTLLINTFIFSQESFINKNYTSYFENTREIPYLHLNKTSFLTGQEIWFRAYVIEQNSKKLHSTTSNLYVSVFDSEGKLKTQKLVHIKDGLGKGNILLDSTFTDNSYYIKASTNWMKNFKEDNSFIQKISICNNNNSKTIKENTSYEFKLFPEGGHTLSNTINNFGILVKNKNGKGIKINKGIIKNSLNEIVRKFSTNSFGLGNTNLFIKEDETYEFEAILENGQVLKTTTLEPQNYGITLKVINSNPNYFLINILTNKSSLDQLNNRKFKILVHNTRKITTYNFNFNSTDTKYSLFINKEDVDKGINIITIFDDKNTPLLERLIFINSPSLFTNIDIKNNLNNINDSISINFKNNTNESIFLSSSFLPIETKSYVPEENINTSFLLKPYIKGKIQNSGYYFNNINKEKLRELDLLLITQGWSKYNWFDVFNNPPKTNYSFENGINIKGTLNAPLKRKQSLLIYSAQNNIIREIKNTNEFQLKSTFVKENSHITFSLKTKNNSYKASPYLQFSNTTLSEYLPPHRLNFKTSKESKVEEQGDISFLFRDTEILDEVLINKKPKTKPSEKPYGANTILTRKIVDSLLISSGETVLDFLKSKRYRVVNDEGVLSLLSRSINSNLTISNPSAIEEPAIGGKSINYNEHKNYDNQKKSVRVYLDNNEISDNLWLIESMNMDTVKEVYYGRVYDNRADEHIYIYTLSPSEYTTKKTFLNTLKIEKGFSIEKEYYTPEYNSYTDNTYKYYGDIFWNPNIEIKANSNFEFKIPQNLQEKIIVYIEGISESGKLISKKHIISTKTN
ncbi:hypothetical protein C8N26_1050 [Tenacibaculum lutimaris]|uniref:MG2 domain-containing protein n=1 Tax=Tenacibaculum lutimaris TaxID=285258 RepID=A0A420E399_9FLAO|nr:hypothetical protein [Tenacibaculum lutimaris]RKF04383.1 hypothetical protein C8N26_1050 [Tenacibaculum lutimaris]